MAAQTFVRLQQAQTGRADAVAADRLVLVSPATSRYTVPAVPPDTLVVEGEADDVVPLDAILEWARPKALPVTVVPGTGHFSMDNSAPCVTWSSATLRLGPGLDFLPRTLICFACHFSLHVVAA